MGFYCFMESYFFKVFCVFTFWLGWVSVAVEGFHQLQRAGVIECGAQASHCSGFSCYGAQALGTWAQ